MGAGDGSCHFGSNLVIDRNATRLTTMASPLLESEIVVSTQPPLLSPPTLPRMIEEPGIPELEQPPIDQPPSTAGDGDAMSKKSFKRSIPSPYKANVDTANS